MGRGDRPRVGLIGAGGIGRVHAEALAQLGVELRIFSRSNAQELAADVGATAAGSLGELLTDCDVVDITTPTTTHLQYAREAIAAGVHVICEKPLTLSVDDSVRMIAAAEHAGVRLLPAHVVRYFPDYEGIHAHVVSGEIGTPVSLRFSRSSAAPPPGSWFFDDARSGGIITDQMIHDIDQALWLAGPVDRVSAMQSQAPGQGTYPERATAAVVLRHRSGALSVLQGRWGSADEPFRTAVEVAGTHGVLRHRSPEPDAAGAAGYLPQTSEQESPYLVQLRDFLDAIRTGRDAMVSAQDGLRAVAVAAAARESVSTGAAVPLKD